MRIIVGGMNHESNTLNPIITGKDDFVVFRGKEILEKGMLPYYSSTGIIEALSEAKCEIVPTVLARAVPNGVVSDEFYYSLKSEMLERIRSAVAEGPVDGICLALHGSMKVNGLGCAEEDILSAIREILPEVRLTVALDMHATITDKMLACADGFVGYKTAPHIDCRETGALAASMLLRSLKENRPLTTRSRSVPMLIAGEKSESAAEPMKSLINMCMEAEKEPVVMAASLLLGFPWADDEHEMVNILVTTLDDPCTADAIATRIAKEFWRRRADFKFRCENYDTEESLKVAFKAAIEDKIKPVFISDSGDNPTAGSTGDSTDILEQILANEQLLDRLPTPLLYSGFYDAQATADCLDAGEGSYIDIEVGGIWDKINGKRIPLKVKVLKLVNDYGPFNSDLALVQHRNMIIALTSKHIGFGDEDLLPALGVDPKDYCIVVVKLGYLEACFSEIAAKAILSTSKGCSNEVLESIPFTRIHRPIYPIDPDTTYVQG
jgi:microcystin degradation protein MlrC